VWLLRLRGSERDGGVEQLEGAALVAGGFGEHGDFGVGACVADLVAGEGGEVVEDASEAAVGVAGLSCWREALVAASLERGAGATGLAGWGGCSSVNVMGAQALHGCQTR
jgi:hypothetical protein